MSDGLTGLLQELQTGGNLRMAAVVGLDGLLIDEASTPDFDAESVAAVAAPGLLMMGDLSQELDEGFAKVTTMEYENHIVVMAPLTEDALLVLVTDAGPTNLGQIRIRLRRATDRLRQALEQV